LVVEDAREDDRFKDTPMVQQEPPIIFYAGVSLINSEGYPLGTLCIADHQPRQLTDFQINILKSLAHQTIKLLELKRKQSELKLKETELAQYNKDLTDSLRYAKYIQKAIFPSPQRINRYVKDSFVFFQPLHIVSGDFYWFKQLNGDGQSPEKIIFGVADCTGHGVPGGFISLIGNNILNKVVWGKEEYRPGRILGQLDKDIEFAFHKEEYSRQMPDGMDISLCSLDLNKEVLYFAGAMNSLYLFRDQTLHELKATPQSIGGFLPHKTAFDEHTISLQEGDTFYMFTDGYPDQFGGPNGKKFMKKRFKGLLQKIHRYPMHEQKNILRSTIREWMEEGDEQQIDDMCVMGFRV
jgi:serine phosphatase RsbU (regulator of sigma subunit)